MSNMPNTKCNLHTGAHVVLTYGNMYVQVSIYYRNVTKMLPKCATCVAYLISSQSEQPTRRML